MPLTVAQLIDELNTRMGWPTADSAKRAVSLSALNDAEQFIAQQGSFQYLSVRTTLDLPNNADSAPAPTVVPIDYAKALDIADPLGSSLDFLPLDEFNTVPLADYDDFLSARPGYFTFALSGTTGTFFFKRQNTTGSTISFTFTYQRIPADLTDAGGFSLLPSGYGRTILLDRAEAQLKRRLNFLGWKDLEERNNQQLVRFFDGQRVTKEKPVTDTDQERRKVAEVKLSEEVG